MRECAKQHAAAEPPGNQSARLPPQPLPATPTLITPQPGGAPRGIDFLSYIPNISMSLMQNFTKQIALVEDYFLCCFPLPQAAWLRRHLAALRRLA